MDDFILGFDADDTLWHNESVFNLTEERFAALLEGYTEPADLTERLRVVELRNLKHYGYGVKGFTLSMIETAIEASAGAAPAEVISEILRIGRAMLEHPVEPLPGVRETLERLAADHRLVLITKGDLLDQENKLARSGLGDFFADVEIVTDKTAATYRRTFARHGAKAGGGAMFGNSVRSDIIPAIEAGYFGVHIPYATTWAHEHAEPPMASKLFARLESIVEAPHWLAGVQSRTR
jgi:putative hydrolase of the HAD superfamily